MIPYAPEHHLVRRRRFSETYTRRDLWMQGIFAMGSVSEKVDKHGHCNSKKTENNVP